MNVPNSGILTSCSLERTLGAEALGLNAFERHKIRTLADGEPGDRPPALPQPDGTNRTAMRIRPSKVAAFSGSGKRPETSKMPRT
jgi:hypothetical protein